MGAALTETTAEQGPRIEVWARGLAPYGATNVRERVCDRLRQLKDEGKITDISMATWGERIDAAPVDAREAFVSPAQEAVTEFETWALEHSYSLQPAFETREIGLPVTGQRREVVVPPVVCLAVYDDSELQAVFPYSDGETVYTVSNCLDLLEADDTRFTADNSEITSE